eukprot:12849246-Ditylum_brightwellii.AAC.1
MQPIFQCAIMIWLFLIARIGVTFCPVTEIFFTATILFAYIMVTGLCVFGRKKNVKKKQTNKHQPGWWYRANVLGWSRSETLYSTSQKEMVLSSYMLTSKYCGLLAKQGKNRVGMIGMIGRIVRNMMLLLTLMEVMKGKELSDARSKLKEAEESKLRKATASCWNIVQRSKWSKHKIPFKVKNAECMENTPADTDGLNMAVETD